MNTWTVVLILSTACVTFCDVAGTETRGSCADQVCPLVCEKICSFVPVDAQATNSSTSSLTPNQPEPYSLCEPICKKFCEKFLEHLGISRNLNDPGFDVELKIENDTPEDLLIANAYLKWGKWTKYPTCEETSSPGGLVIPPNGTVQLKSCGRENTPAGIEGGFDIQVKAGSKRVANIYFEIPWRPSPNKFELKNDPSSSYICRETIPHSVGMQKSVRCK